MPPRYAYWTIIVDDQPTAFRAGALDDIMPTFNRLKEKQPTAKLMWFQSGKLWPSRIDAREAMQVRGERGRYSNPRQDGGERPQWKSKDFSAKPRSASPPSFAKASTSAKATADKSEGKQGAKPSSHKQSERPEWKRKPSGGRPEWKPRGASGDRPAWKPKGAGDRPAWKPRGADDRPAWQPKGAPGGRPFMGRQDNRQELGPSSHEDPAKRKWIPKAEYKKLTGTEAKRDDKWRPGGEHKDPRQKYIDAKKAKWGRFKQAIRSRASKSKKS